MKTTSHSFTVIRAMLCLALGALAQCSKPAGPAPAAAAPSSGTISLVSEGQSPSFRAVASHLELGARSFSYTEADSLPKLAAFMDEIIKSLPASERAGMPPGSSMTRLFDLFGLNSITATGSSSRARADGTFHSRSFVYTPQGRKGLLSLSGSAASKLTLLDLAPKDTDLALEFPLYLKDFAGNVLPGILELIPSNERPKFEAEMNQPLPVIGISAKQLCEKLDGHASIFLRLDPTQKYTLQPGMPPTPGVDFLIVLDRVGWLFDLLKPQFLPKLQSPGSPVTVTMDGDVLNIRAQGPMMPPPMDFQPVLRFDPKADRIIFASRPAIFDGVTAGTDKFTQRPDFADLWRDLPTEGNSCIFASSRFLQTAADAVAASVPSSGPDAAIMEKVIAFIKPVLNHGQALVMANQTDGILTAANSSIALGSSSMTTISTVAVLASLAVPVFSKVQEKGKITQEISNLRQVAVALRLYASDHAGKYPAELSELTKAGVLDTPSLLQATDGATGQRQAWIYNNTLTDSSPPSQFLLASPFVHSGKRSVAMNDCSVAQMPESTFAEMRRQQGAQP